MSEPSPLKAGRVSNDDWLKRASVASYLLFAHRDLERRRGDIKEILSRAQEEEEPVTRQDLKDVVLHVDASLLHASNALLMLSYAAEGKPQPLIPGSPLRLRERIRKLLRRG